MIYNSVVALGVDFITMNDLENNCGVITVSNYAVIDLVTLIALLENCIVALL